MARVAYVTKSGIELTDEDIERYAAEAEGPPEIPRLPTMQTTTDVLPLFLMAMTDLAKALTRMTEKEIERM